MQQTQSRDCCASKQYCGDDHCEQESCKSGHGQDCGAGCCNDHEKPNYIAVGAGIALAIIALIIKTGPLAVALFAAAYLLIGYRQIMGAARNIARGKVFDENFLMTIATIGAFAIGEYTEAIAVLLFYQAGEYFQELAVRRSRKSISALLEMRPDMATLESGETVPAQDVNVGDVIVVRPGERIPLDGTVVSGNSQVNNAAITGESLPVETVEGTTVYSGGVNLTGLLGVRVDKPFGESTASKILEMVENASMNKARTESFITRFARVYTPVVCALAVMIAVVPTLLGQPFQQWLYNALVFLVISCPCALVISIPLGFFGGIGGASKHGVLFKGGNSLETMAAVDVFALDKTGTLTTGVMQVKNIHEEMIGKEELIRIAAHAESFSRHPIAAAITGAYGQTNKDVIEEYEYVSGGGVKAKIEGKRVLAGNLRFMRENGVPVREHESSATHVYIALDGVYAGLIEVGDTIKPNASAAINQLKELGVKRIAMLTGDGKAPAAEIATEAGIDEVYAQLLPQGKAERVKDMIACGNRVAFVGDGINDSPVLALADVGIAMGGVGSEAAIEAADVVILNDDLKKIPTAIRIARKTKRIVAQNIALALGIKLLVMFLGTLGMATMWEAVIADVGVALLATLNAMRAMRGAGKD